MSYLDKYLDHNEQINSNVMTPESIAWKLITDENLEKNGNFQMLTFADEQDEQNDPITFLFEILLTVYFEMLFGLGTLEFLLNNEDTDLTEKDFKPDLEQITLDQLNTPYSDKFKIIKYLLFITPLSVDDFIYYKNDAWCKIMLKDYKPDETFFEFNSKYIDTPKRYCFIRNSLYIKKTKLNEVYALCNLGKSMYKINFSSLLLNKYH
jgi:hypothetical protein